MDLQPNHDILVIRYFEMKIKVSVSVLSVYDLAFTITYGSSRSQIFYQIGISKDFAKFTEKHLCRNFFFDRVAGLQHYPKNTLAQVFSCEFCHNYKDI